MSIHPSLRGANTLMGDRSVWTRTERIQALIKKGKFDPEADSVLGLPKVRTRTKILGGKKKAKEKTEGEGETGAEASADEKPAS